MAPDTPTPAEPLKPCPFCGGAAEMQAQFSREWWVQCPSCDACHGVIENTERAALERWNRRAEIAQPATPEPVEVLHVASLLEAMARNYAGGHCWDHLDGLAVERAARLLRATQPATHVALTDERAAFERWERANSLDGEFNEWTESKWSGWSARAALATQVASSSIASNTLGDAADAAGLSAPALRASAAIPIAGTPAAGR